MHIIVWSIVSDLMQEGLMGTRGTITHWPLIHHPDAAIRPSAHEDRRVLAQRVIVTGIMAGTVKSGDGRSYVGVRKTGSVLSCRPRTGIGRARKEPTERDALPTSNRFPSRNRFLYRRWIGFVGTVGLLTILSLLLGLLGTFMERCKHQRLSRTKHPTSAHLGKVKMKICAAGWTQEYPKCLSLPPVRLQTI
jgi:hypothetical protein